MIFCMTLAGYSARAYSFIRDVANKCLPSQKTLRNYRKRVDGKIVFSFISMKGKHMCRSVNMEQTTLIRHKNTKQILFKHE